jgi:hypothetical protein
MGSYNIAQLGEEEVQTARANRMKIQQEVFDLAIDNEIQKTQAAEFQQPDRAATRTALDTAERKKAQAVTSKAFMSMRDDEFERAEAAIAVATQSPGPESYKAARALIAEADPYLSKSMPVEYSPKAMERLKAISQAAIRSKSFRQEMVKQGHTQDFQASQAKNKFQYDSDLLEARYGFEAGMQEAKLKSMLEQQGVSDAAAEVRTRIATSPFEIKAIEAERANLPEIAEGYRYMAVQHAILELQAEMAAANKASGGPDQSLLDARAVKLSDDIAKSVSDDWAANDQVKRAVGYDRVRKELKATGLKPTARALFNIGRSQNIPAEELSGWVKDRMFLDMSTSGKAKWKRLAQDSRGNLVDGITSRDIMGWVGKTPSAAHNPNWKGGKVNSVKDAQKFYEYILRERHNRKW